MRSLQKIQLNDNYWPQVFIALGQITFGVAWGSLFLPLDAPGVIVIITNFIISGILILVGHFVRKRK